jgi:predicted dehydrogenase
MEMRRKGEKVKLIHIGVGGYGRRWSQALAATKDVEVVALVDTVDEALAGACQAHGYQQEICYPTLEEALDVAEADMVLCVSPPQYHAEQIATAVAAGLDVLCEKPMATQMDDCLAILEAAQESGRTVAISQQYRYRPETQALAELVRQGAIGEIGQLKIDFYKGWYFEETDFRRTMPYPILVDMAIHHFDLLRFISGLEALSVRGESWNPPWSENLGDSSASLTFALNNGARFVYNASWCAQGDFSDWNGDWLIEGDKGSIRYEKGEIVLNQAAGRYKVARSEAVSPRPMKLKEQEFVLRYFIDSVRNGILPETAVTDNIRSIAMVFAAVRAVEVGQRTHVIDAELERLLDGSARGKGE